MWAPRWWGPGRTALLVRGIVTPAATGVRLVAAARAAAYGAGWLPRHVLPAPTVSVGNLQVGGAGKTPLAGWIAGRYAQRGVRPGILLRGYGGDEAPLHRAAAPGVVVEVGADRRAAAARAVAAGAEVRGLEDAFQRLDVARDLDLVALSAELCAAGRQPLPAGPWREGWRALARADLLVVTVKTASARAVAATIAALRRSGRPGTPIAVARLRPATLRGLVSGRCMQAAELRGARVLAVAGVFDPEAFGRQVARWAKQVRLAAFPDHYRYGPRVVERIVHRGREVDYVVLTAKDAVKLRPLWPADAPEPLVADLRVQWTRGRREVEHLLDAALHRDDGVCHAHAPLARMTVA